MKRVISRERIELNAYGLYALLANLQMQVDLETLHIQDGSGHVFTRAELIEETLTDGSIVYNLVLR